MTRLVDTLMGYILRLDMLAVEFVLRLRSPFVTELMNSVTGLGSVSAGLVFVGLFYLAGWREEFLTTLFALSITGVVVAALMATVQRPFPPQPVCAGGEAATTSFPSGHSAAVAAYATIARSSERLPFVVVAALAVLIAFSRVYLGTHYLSDTLFGIALGIAAAIAARRLLERIDVDALLARLSVDSRI